MKTWYKYQTRSIQNAIALDIATSICMNHLENRSNKAGSYA